MSDTALNIVQDLLDRQGTAIMDNDWDALAETFSYPYRRVLTDADVIVESEEQMRRGLMVFRNSLEGMGANHFVRLASNASRMGEKYIEGHYVTHVLRNAVRLVPSYASRIVLARNSYNWRVIEMESRLVSSSWPLDLLRVKSGADRLPSSGEDDVRRTQADPMNVYQAFIDKLSAATMDRDFDAFYALCDKPYLSHGAAYDKVVDRPEETREFFEGTCEMTNGRIADTLHREARNAQFLGANLICGYHEARYTKDGADVIRPIQSRMLVKRYGSEWKLSSVANSINNAKFPYSAPMPSQGLVTQLEIQKRMKHG